MCNYLGTESSPRSDFSGLQRTVMTELRPRSHDAVTCVELKEHKHTSGTWTQQKYLTVASSFLFLFTCRRNWCREHPVSFPGKDLVRHWHHWERCLLSLLKKQRGERSRRFLPADYHKTAWRYSTSTNLGDPTQLKLFTQGYSRGRSRVSPK